jgi:hypothetical protein
MPNYIRESFNTDLDFGTGEWSVGAWVNVPVTLLTLSAFPVLNTELLTNGDFSAGTTGWSYTVAGTSTAVISSGQATITKGDSYAFITQSALTVGKSYSVTLDVVSISGTAAVVNQSGTAYATFTAIGTYTFRFTHAAGANSVFYLSANSGSVTFDNVSLRELGSVSIIDRAHSSGAKISLGVTPAGFLTATAFDGTTTRTVTTAAAYNTATWLKAEAQYKTDGSLGIVVNGQEVAVTRGNPLLSLNNSNAVLTIGNSYALDAPFPGSIALLKMSATVPTAEQSLWMYEQEKQMFRDGAQVTLPDAGNIVDLTYDDLTDKWIAVSATNESEFSGLIRTSVTPSPAGSYSKITATSGVQLLARSTTSPGVDITAPAQNLREELLKDAEAAARMNAQLAVFDYVGGFTATTVTGNTAITSVASLTYPVSYIGARVTGSGIPADTFVAGVVGTTVYLTKAATASASAVAISFTDFILPTGMEAKEVSLAGVAQREGATAQFTRLFDGFKETIRFGTAPSNTALIQIQAARSAA